MNFKEVAIRAAKEAGAVLKSHYFSIKNVEIKGKHDLVTVADKDSEEKIIGIIREAFPDHNIVAEESGDQKKDSDYEWIIDPMDGTNDYVMGIPYFSVSIALAKNNEVILGVIYNPVLDELYVAEKGRGAFLNDQPITVSARYKLSESMVTTSYLPEDDDIKKGLDRAKTLSLNTRKVIVNFSSALDLCNVARGRIDAVVDSGTLLVDHAAAALIVSEAGGKVQNFDGEDWDVKQIGIVASNGRIHDELIRLL